MRCNQGTCTCEGGAVDVDEGEYCSETCADLDAEAPAPDEVSAVPPSIPEKPCPCGHAGCQAAPA